MSCSLLAIKRCHHGWVLAAGDLRVIRQGLRNEPARPRLHEVARRMADHALVSGAAGLQVGFRKIKGRDGGSPTGLRLRHIRACHLADVEAILGGAQITREYGHVVLAQTHDRLIAHDIHVGGHGLEQDRLLDRAQRLAPGPDGGLGLSNGVHHAEAAKERLDQLDRVAARIGAAIGNRARLRGGLLKAVSALPVTVGRYPEMARGTSSSVARSVARAASSRGLTL